MGTGSDDNKNGGILKLAEHVLKKPFTTALWVFATDNTLDVKRVKNNENQRLYSNHMVKNLFYKWVLHKDRFPARKNHFIFIALQCSGED